jgi:hypothetical protein
MLLILIFVFYILFTLLPDSHGLMVTWPWVFIWQVGLLCPIIWFVSILWRDKIKFLGGGFDLLVGASVFGLLISSLLAQFTDRALWYTWSALGFVAAIYCLNFYLQTSQDRDRLLTTQGYLNVVFILISLTLWTSQTLLPELSQLKKFQDRGVNLNFDFSILELRNWAPIGHQNYVAGYLVLALPLLLALTLLKKGWQRWLWGISLFLGAIDLYTTSSRGGWLGLIIACFVFFLLLSRPSSPSPLSPYFLIPILGAIALFISTNNRLQGLLTGKNGGELVYRLINADIGWRMGLDRPFTGVGLGGVLSLYQKYHPFWAGRESEMAYQLHSTPVQLWAEIGIWGVIAIIGAIALIAYWSWHYCWRDKELKFSERIFTASIAASCCGYFVTALTDYQLDNISITGTLVLFLSCLTSLNRQPLLINFPTKISLFGFGLIFAIVIWLIPIHRAWQLGDRGFVALSENNLTGFVEALSQAEKLAPWDAYYADLLGWNLGDLALKTGDGSKILSSLTWWEKAIKTSPYREFPYNNQGWLSLGVNKPEIATRSFVEALQLLPAKRGLMYGLGLSLLNRGKSELAIAAMSLEILRDPVFITSPLWRYPQLQTIYPQVIDRALSTYNSLLQKEPNNAYWHQCRGALFWWKGNLIASNQDWQKYGSSLSKTILQLSLEKKINNLSSSRGEKVIAAWLDPSQREKLLEQAWIEATRQEIPEKLKQQLLVSMATSQTFEEWLKQKMPIFPYRRQRDGFGAVSRHLGGSTPQDFWFVIDNIAIATWFEELFPSPSYYPELDITLEPMRRELLSKVINSNLAQSTINSYSSATYPLIGAKN